MLMSNHDQRRDEIARLHWLTEQFCAVTSAMWALAILAVLARLAQELPR